ncbi:hypothetical protein LTR67_000665 [Exophiala xenobiotica]|nr:hypothetical protein LTR18_002986 [Exophiala xenobiotica]KAK5449898.1 hypothetical protein LTS15_008471 [Exophiala xenobiotica]
MDNIVREGEQFLGNEEGNQGGSQGMDQSNLMGGQQNAQEGQQSQQGQSDQQGGGMMKSFEQNTGDAYVNQEVNQFLGKEGVPNAMDGAIDGAVDTEANKLEKDF